MDTGYVNQQGSSDNVRSYTCAFCRRGFSNAQALGGHMNIHRKDRARLRQSYDEAETSLCLDVKNVEPTATEHIRLSDENSFGFSESNEEQSCITFRRKLHGSPELVELPFFTDMKKSSDTSDSESEEKKVALVHGSSQTEGLDLELRLGLDPNHDKSPRTNTS